MYRPARRNALSREHLARCWRRSARRGDRRHRLVLAGEGPVFSAGHDFADVAGRRLCRGAQPLGLCTDLCRHPVRAAGRHRPGARARHRGRLPAGRRVRPRGGRGFGGLRRAGRQGRLVLPHPDGRDRPRVGRKRPMELALTGDPIDAATAREWGLVNRVVPDADLDAAVADLLARATRGSGQQGVGKDAPRPARPPEATPTIAVEAMAAASQLDDANEGMAASWRSARRSGPTERPQLRRARPGPAGALRIESAGDRRDRVRHRLALPGGDGRRPRAAADPLRRRGAGAGGRPGHGHRRRPAAADG